MNVVAYASLAFLIVSILACSFVAYRVRPRSYIVRDTMFLKCVSWDTINVRSYEAVIAEFQVNDDSNVVSATIYDGWYSRSQATRRHLRAVHNFVNDNDIPTRIIQARS